jgi:molybdopterin-guanine dinucleotide biosynthesis protein A
MVHNISGVILAGGANRRFNGRIKANIIINGKKIISLITDTIGDIFEEIIVVTNTPEEFKESGNCKIVSDQILKAGPLGGIHAAIKASSKEAIFVFASDMPLLNRSIIIRQIEQYNEQKPDVLVPRIDETIEPLHAIYNISLLRTLEEYLLSKQNYAVREFFKLVDVSFIQFDETEEILTAFTNINTPEDVITFEKLL